MSYSNLDYKQRKALSDILHKGLHTDNNYNVHFDFCDKSAKYVNDVVDFFYFGSKPIYPQKYIFCNIIFSYYLNKYFGVDFYQALSDNSKLDDSPLIYSYKDHKNVYDHIIGIVGTDIDHFPSVIATRHYFKQQYLIDDEDISDISNVKMF